MSTTDTDGRGCTGSPHSVSTTAEHSVARGSTPRPDPKSAGAVQSLGVRYSSPPSGPRGPGGDGRLAPAGRPGQTIARPAAQAVTSGISGARTGAGLSGPAPVRALITPSRRDAGQRYLPLSAQAAWGRTDLGHRAVSVLGGVEHVWPTPWGRGLDSSRVAVQHSDQRAGMMGRRGVARRTGGVS